MTNPNKITSTSLVPFHACLTVDPVVHLLLLPKKSPWVRRSRDHCHSGRFSIHYPPISDLFDNIEFFSASYGQTDGHTNSIQNKSPHYPIRVWGKNFYTPFFLPLSKRSELASLAHSVLFG